MQIHCVAGDGRPFGLDSHSFFLGVLGTWRFNPYLIRRLSCLDE
jgi:hypothetical protein